MTTKRNSNLSEIILSADFVSVCAITSKEQSQLIKEINSKIILNSATFEFKAVSKKRLELILIAMHHNLSFKVINEFISKAKRILEGSLVNKERQAQGKSSIKLKFIK